jgi:DNA polymerase-3 subunit delta
MTGSDNKAGSIKISDYRAIRADLKAGIVQNVYVVFGEEDFLIEKVLENIQKLVLNNGVTALDKVKIDADGQSSRIDYNKLKAELMTPPFMSARKLVIVRNSNLFTMAANSAESEGGAQKERQRIIQELIKNIPDCACLVFVEQKIDKRLKSLLQAVHNAGLIVEIQHEKPLNLKKWIQLEFQQRNISITGEAAESLADRCDQSMRVIWSEMNKIFLYLEYTGQTKVDVDTISDLSLPDLRGTVFELTDAISFGRTADALILLDNLIKQRQPVQLIQFMMARHFRQLICAAELGKQDKLASTIKVMPFVASKLIRQSRQFTLPVMERIYELCLESDMSVKTGKMDDRLSLETLLIRSGEAAKISIRR